VQIVRVPGWENALKNLLIHLLLACLGLMALCLLLWWVVRFIRHRVLRPPEEEFGFSLMQLERLYKRGEITEEEFKAIKRKRALKAAGMPAGPNSTGGPAKPQS
jgi:uncharacterized membrane protein